MLELVSVHAGGLRVGPRTELSADGLVVDVAGLAAELRRSTPGIGELDVHLASPGDATRVVCVKDVVEPRVKVSGGRVGEGTVVRLVDVAVVTCGRIVGYQEGLIDLSGPGAAHSPFSQLHLVVVEAQPLGSVTPHEHEAMLRLLGLRAAELVGRAVAGGAPAEVLRVDWAERPVPAGLPRVAYLDLLISQGLLHDTWVDGRNAAEPGVLPTLMAPAAVLDTAIVSGNCVSACDKNTTWHHQRNPLVLELLRRHGRDLDLAGVVLSNLPVRLAGKEASVAAAARLLRQLDVAGVVISTEGFGNPDADVMMLIRDLEGAGIATVALTDEFAGADGASPSLADTTPEAVAIVSTGNANERVLLPPMDRTIGPVADLARLTGGSAKSVRPDGAVEVELQVVMGATNQLGNERLSCEEV
jgi:glycine reductase